MRQPSRRVRAARPVEPQVIIVLKGLPGSGKSTWARDLIAREPERYKRINKDDLRAMLDGGRWSETSEKFIVRARDVLLDAALSAGRSVIIDDTNLEPAHEARIRHIAAGRAQVEVRFFDVPLEECIRRDSLRPQPVGESVIRQMHARWLANRFP
jgi:predicted kinase